MTLKKYVRYREMLSNIIIKSFKFEYTYKQNMYNELKQKINSKK